MAALPVKTSIRIDAIIESAQRNLEAARKNGHPITVTNDVISCLIDGLAQTLLNPKQQEQISRLLALWQEDCSAESVEDDRLSVMSARRVS